MKLNLSIENLENTVIEPNERTAPDDSMERFNAASESGIFGSAIEEPSPISSPIIVSVVVPMRNEAQHIHSCLRSLVGQSFPSDKYEIWVADGRSTDRSRETVSVFEQGKVQVRLLDNALQTTPSGINLGIRAAKGQIIVIAGAHAVYPADFIENCVYWLDKTGADVVGGPVRTEAENGHFGARMATLVLTSPFGVGNSRFRTSSEEGWVDTVPFGAYRRAILDRVGLFNERLVRNQDNDLSARIRRAGGKIYLTPALTTTYIPVRNFTDLLRQAFRKSQWHIFTLRENVLALGFRHLCPAALVVAVAGLLVFSAVSSLGLMLLAILAFSYLSLGFWIALGGKSRGSLLSKSLLPFACFFFHCAYGIGTLVGLRHLFGLAPP